MLEREVARDDIVTLEQLAVLREETGVEEVLVVEGDLAPQALTVDLLDEREHTVEVQDRKDEVDVVLLQLVDLW